MEYSSTKCTILVFVIITEIVLIVTINFITILVFAKTRSLRKPCMYVMVNLALADMLNGGFSESCFFYATGGYCFFWKNEHINYSNDVIFCLMLLFPVASLANLATISLERLHATFRPFKHRVITKRIYGIVIAAGWALLLLLMTFSIKLGKVEQVYYLWNSVNVIFLSIICVSYASIVFKIYCGPHRVLQQHHHGAVLRERKLTKTLLIVTVASLVTCVPNTVRSFLLFFTDFYNTISRLTAFWVDYPIILLFYANSLVNPILYATRIPDFKRAVISLFRCRRP
ncbi:histamine H2 receptor-like [Montipora foliosa]|uniref:histamine H2 receptor-like n=1 Tax=Montipora foliosa TaxID=591990 RepID=UPI0035F17490